MTYELKNTIANDLLCYIASARSSMTKNAMTTSCVGFYSPEAIKEAKELISKLNNERPITRRKTDNNPNPNLIDLQDICACFEKLENNANSMIPTFVASGFSAFPPRGFEAIAPTICALRDELAAYRVELAELKNINERDARSINNVNILMQDVSEMKTMMHHVYTSTPKRSQAPPPNDILQEQGVMASSTTPTTNDASHSSDHGARNNSTDLVVLSSDSSANGEGSQIERDNEANAEHGGGFTLVQNRPYANAIRRSGLPANPNRRGGHQRGGANGRGPHNDGRRTGSDGQLARGQRNNIIVGSRPSESDIAANDRVYDIYVGGCNPQSNEQSIENFCIKYGVTPKKCLTLPIKSEWVKSYKVSVTAEDRDKILKADFWPTGVFVRKFFRGKNQSN